MQVTMETASLPSSTSSTPLKATTSASSAPSPVKRSSSTSSTSSEYYRPYLKCISNVVRDETGPDEDDELDPFFEEAEKIVKSTLEKHKRLFVQIQYIPHIPADDSSDDSPRYYSELEYSHGTFVDSLEEYQSIVGEIGLVDLSRCRPVGGRYGLIIFTLDETTAEPSAPIETTPTLVKVITTKSNEPLPAKTTSSSETTTEKQPFATPEFICVLCNKTVQGFGNNPEPCATSGQCCNDCSASKVLPARLAAVKIGTVPITSLLEKKQ